MLMRPRSRFSVVDVASTAAESFAEPFAVAASAAERFPVAELVVVEPAAGEVEAATTAVEPAVARTAAAARMLTRFIFSRSPARWVMGKRFPGKVSRASRNVYV
jgi:hypothetical protein